MQIPKISRFINIVVVLSEEAIRWIIKRIRGGQADEY